MQQRKVVLIGLDCCDPRFLFERWKDQLPVLSNMMDYGTSGPLESITPCITIPAWACMFSGKDPGELGIYGFKNRLRYDYYSNFIPYSDSIKGARIWDLLGAEGYQSIIVGVPQTYPVQPIKGHLVSGILTPSTECQYTYPASLKNEITELLHPYTYQFDIDNFRKLPKEQLFDQINKMTELQLVVFEKLLNEKAWDFAALVLIGTDRINHGFWDFIDSEHPDYIPGNKYEMKILNYYQMLDAKIGQLIDETPDGTVFLIVSDHGAKRMQGAVCINEWLIKKGYLVLKNQHKTGQIRPLQPADIDWTVTKAWGEGGYCGRIWINLQGREVNGTVRKEDYPSFREHLKKEIEMIPGPGGEHFDNRCFIPEQIYRTTNRIAPDLLIYFDNLAWRSIGSIGFPSIFSQENDSGVDGANHSQSGIFIHFDPDYNGKNKGQVIQHKSILEIKDIIFELVTGNSLNQK